MEFTDSGLELTLQEASDLAEVFMMTATLHDWGKRSGVVREPSEEERTEAEQLSKLAQPASGSRSDSSEAKVIIRPEHFQIVSKIAELALDNSQKVVSGLCTPSIPDGYRSEWRPAAYCIMAMTAEISETIQRLPQ